MMQTRIERILDDRVAVLSLFGEIDTSNSDVLRDVLHDVFAVGFAPEYLVIDGRRLQVSFSNLNTFMRQQRATRSLENSYASQLHIPPIYVGTSPLAETYISVGLPHAFRVDRAPAFATRDEAISYIKSHLRRHARI